MRSVSVVTSGPVAVAGSIPKRWNENGTNAPNVAAMLIEVSVPSPMTSEKSHPKRPL